MPNTVASRRRRAGAPLLLLALALLSGCARLALMYSDDPLADFQQARADQRYERALYIAQHLDADDPAHERVQALLPELRREIEQFEDETIERAERLADQDRWARVWEELDRAAKRWRASQPLRQARERLRERQEREMRILESKLLVAEARWRLSSASLADRLAHFTLSTAERRRKDWQDRNRALAEELVDHGRWFAGREDWPRANRCLKNAQALDPDAPPGPLLARVEKQVSAASRRSQASQARARRRQAEARREQARSQLEQYLESGELARLLELREFLQRHDEVEFPDELTAKVEMVSRERFRAGMAEGDARYAQGEYRAARSAWRRIEPLAPPDSDLSKKLERVQRVIDKLENLEDD